MSAHRPTPVQPRPHDALALLDYRRRTAELYAAVRRDRADPEARWWAWRRGRDALFARHPMSPLEPDARGAFRGLAYFPYDPAWRATAELEPDPGPRFEVRLRDDGVLQLQRVGRLHAELGGAPRAFALYRRLGYGGGLFLPFAYATAGAATYGGGRYLLDTVKHADLGSEGGRLVLDLNFAYHPSCVYSARWDCPLTPAENRMPYVVEAGERLPERPGAAPAAGRSPVADTPRGEGVSDD